MGKIKEIYLNFQRSPRPLKWLVKILTVGALYAIFNWMVMPLYTRQFQSITVPDVTGKSWDEAVELLQRKGLQAVKGLEKYDETTPAGYVLFQNPGVDLPVKKGRRVYLTLSKGRRTFRMPHLVGESERDARFILEQEELALAGVSYRSDPYYPDGVVCAQSIAPDEEVTVGQRVHLVISLGAEPTDYIVPNVIGKSQNEAVHDILKAGLTLGDVVEQPTEELVPYTVVGQSPPAGSILNRGDAVNLVVTIVPQ